MFLKINIEWKYIGIIKNKDFYNLLFKQMEVTPKKIMGKWSEIFKRDINFVQ